MTDTTAEPQTFSRKGRLGWQAETEIALPGVTKTDHNGECQGYLKIYTAKSERGGIYSSASVAFRSGAFMTHGLYRDFSVRIKNLPDARCTEKSIMTLHNESLARLDEITRAALDHYAENPPE